MSAYKPTVNFTTAQSNAINALNRSLVISAAAGSGKTAVLSERILKRIMDDVSPADIRKLLIVTFTRAAAGELKERLYKKLDTACKENPSSKRLSEQLSAVNDARISTVHSFCFDIIKLCFYDLGLPADIRIGTATEIKLIKDKVIRELIEAYYEKGASENIKLSSDDYEAFTLFSDICSNGKNDNGIVSALEGIYDKMISYPLPAETLEFNCNRLEKEIEAVEKGDITIYDTSAFSMLFKEAALNAQKAYSLIRASLELCNEDVQLQNAYTSFIGAEIVFFNHCKDDFSPTGIKHLKDSFQGYKKGRMPPVKGYTGKLKDTVSKTRKSAHEALEKAFSLIFEKDEDELLEEMKGTLRIQKVISAATKDFITLFTMEKLKKGIVDFSDLEHFAFFALVRKETYNFTSGNFEKTDFAKKVTEELDEIYVDEYQDTNMLQDAIFRAVSREDNLFTVGDVKQSIYGFRGAVPDIFMKRTNAFSDYAGNDDGNLSSRIFLSNNFRSDKNCIDLVNEIFDTVMNPRDKKEYPESERLIFSKKEDSALKNEIYIIDSSSKKEDTEEEDEFSDAEALLIAARIDRLMKENIISEKGEKLSYSDIAVLTRKNSSLLTIKRALENLGIPVSAEKDTSFLDSAETLFFISLLSAVDNPLRDIYLLAVMASPVFGFSSDELYKIRCCHSGRFFYNALKTYAENGEDESLSKKSKDFLNTLSEYRSYALKNKVSDTMRYILDSSELMYIWPGDSEKQLETRKSNLLFIFGLAAEYDSFSGGNISEFCEYLLNLSSDESPSSETDSDSVKLMTIHKSKGLEFPICFISQTGSKFINKELTENVVTDISQGPVFHLISDDGFAKINTFIRTAVLSKLKTELVREEKRVLYVGLTRARQKLIITGTTRSVPDIYPKSSSEILSPFFADSAKTHLDMIAAGCMDNEVLKKALSEYKENEDITEAFSEELSVSIIPLRSVNSFLQDRMNSEIYVDAISEDGEAEDENLTSRPLFDPYIDTEKASPLSDELLQTLDFVYPYEGDIYLPAKVSVSDIYKKSEHDTSSDISTASSEVLLNPPERITNKTDSGGAFAGTAMHEFMQFCDFDEVVLKGTEAECLRLVKEGYIREDKEKVISHKKLGIFFSSELFKRIKESKKTHREMRFNVFITPSEAFGETEITAQASDLLVQGVIDCFFENPDGTYTLIDYKTDHVLYGHENELKEKYSNQLRIYKAAIEKMVNSEVRDVFIYSFALDKALKLDI